MGEPDRDGIQEGRKQPKSGLGYQENAHPHPDKGETMTDEKAAKIKELSKVYTEKKMIFDAMGMRNICGRKEDEIIEMAQESHLAEAVMLEAYAALKAAQQA
jgi:hypothetical protein